MSDIRELNAHVIAAQPDYDERLERERFRKVVSNLKTVLIHCFDPRVTGGIPYAVAEALPDQDYPGEIYEFTDDHGKTNFGTSTTIFPVINAGGKADDGALRSIAVASHLFDIDNAVVVHHTDCGGTHATGEGFFERFKEDFDQDLSERWKPSDIGWIKNFDESLALDVGIIRDSVGTPKHVNVYGYAYDIETGKLHLVAESPGDPTAPRGKPWR
jgi:carbonic anhydrase